MHDGIQNGEMIVVSQVIENESLRQHVTEVLLSKGYRQKGSEIFIHCPWHSEKTPSLSCHVGYKLRPGSFHCFGCGEKGDWKKLSAAIFGESYRPEITPASPREGSDQRPRYDVPEVGKILDGLFKSVEREEKPRFVTGLEDFPKGFEWRGLSGKLLASIGASFYFDIKTLEEYVHFPLTMSGDYYGYTLSHLNRRSDCNIPKHAVYAKSKKVLFLYDQVKTGEVFVLTEGHFDAMRLFASGIPAMAIFGVENWSEEKKIRIINKMPAKVVILMDGDDPGYTVARRVYYDLAPVMPVELIDLPRVPDGMEKMDAGNMPDEWLEYVRGVAS